ncbi:hypothetical protein DAEQUDRAFT_721345 [Daedalea quercina L-15889]|uniref:Uncharacterized protein n=1 Tax=Daedalea quercina L-15889 TaxID=1314783 RepID=A0A165TS92_9APHY|nr:hypothetical protein DAEQUDRAFT_721345 [Daedalea quercina L-15889]
MCTWLQHARGRGRQTVWLGRLPHPECSESESVRCWDALAEEGRKGGHVGRQRSAAARPFSTPRRITQARSCHPSGVA